MTKQQSKKMEEAISHKLKEDKVIILDAFLSPEHCSLSMVLRIAFKDSSRFFFQCRKCSTVIICRVEESRTTPLNYYQEDLKQGNK